MLCEFALRKVGVLTLLVASLAMQAATSMHVAHGQSIATWNLTANGDWNVADNWLPSGVPGSGTSTQLVFNTAGATSYTATNNIGAFTLNGLTLATDSGAGTGTITVAGANVLTLNGSGAFVSASGSGAKTVASDLTYAATNATISNAGALLTLGGKQVFGAGTTTTFSGTGDITAGPASGTAAITFANNASIAYNGSGTFKLADGGSYAGGTTANPITVNLSNTGTGTFGIGDMSGVVGTLNIAAGTVKFVQGAAADDLFGNNLVLNVAAGATFDFNGNGETMGVISGTGVIKGASLTMQKAGTYTWGGSIQGTGTFSTGLANTFYTFTGNNTTTGAITVAASTSLTLGNGGTTGSVASNIVNKGVLKFNRSDDVTYSSVISDVGTIEKLGAGTLTLSGTNSYTGPTTVSAGTLRVMANTTASDYTVADGAGLTVANIAPGTSYKVKNLTLGTTGTTTLGFEFNGAGLPTVPVIDMTTNTLTANGTVNVRVSSQNPLVAGASIPLLKYGTLAGTSAWAAFTAGTLTSPPRVVGALENDTATTTIKYNVTSADLVKWNGAISNTWDVGTAVDVGGTNNFKLGSNSAATNFVPGDTVVFDDSAAGNFTVALPSSVQPGSVTFANEAGTYKLQGPGAIAGSAALTKTGAGSAVLANDNTYTGLTTVLGGTLQLGDGGTIGSVAGDILVSSSGTLALNRSDDITYTKPFSGLGTINKNGSNQVTVRGNQTAFTGTLNVNGGTFLLDGTTTADLNASAININNGGKFIFGLGNPNFPDTTFVTVNAGGELQFLVGETFGGVKLSGGTYRLTGANAGQSSTMNGSGPLAGYNLESGSILGENYGTGLIALNGSATNALNKTTPGTVTVAGKVVFSDATPINIKEGTLSFDTTSFPTGSATAAAVTLGDASTSGTLELAGPGAVNLVRGLKLNAGGGLVKVADPTASITLATVSDSALATGTLAKVGAGTLILTPAPAFTGTTAINEGAVRVTPGTAGGGFSIAESAGTGAKLVVAGPATPATLAMPSLSLAAGGASVAFELTSAGNPSVPLINVTGADGLVLNGGTHTLSITTTDQLVPGIITLIDYTGAAITSGFKTGVLPPRTLAEIVYNTANTSIDLNVTGADKLKWNGSASDTWDVGTAVNVGGTWNFKLSSNSAATNFFTGDSVVFDDSAAGNFTVNLPAGVQPFAVSFSNASNAYKLQGAGAIAGVASLTKSGTGAVILANDNTYSGLTTVAEGTLQIGDTGNTGSIAGNVMVTGGTLQIGGTAGSSGTVGGNVTATGGIVQIGGAGSGGTIAGNATVGGAGILKIGGAGGGGTIAGNVTVTSGGTLLVGATTGTGGAVAGNLTVEAGGAATIGNGATAGAVNGDWSVAGSGAINLNRSDSVTMTRKLIGNGTFNMNGPGQFTILSASSGFTATVNVNQGIVVLDDLGAGGDLNATGININAGGKFIFGGSGGDPDLPNNTCISVAAGGELQFLRNGEQYGTTRLQGGTFRLTGNNGGISMTMASATAFPFAGYALESGSIIAENTGSSSATLNGSATNPVEKTTADTVTFTGKIVVSDATPIKIKEGTLSFDASNFPTGSATAEAITLGDAATNGKLRFTGTGAVSLARPLAIVTGGGGTIEVVDPAATVTIAAGATAISGGGNLTKTGVGTLRFTPTASFTGTTAVNEGTVRVTPSDSGGGFSVAPGATLAIPYAATPVALTVPSLSLAATGTSSSTIAFELSAVGNPTVPLINVLNADGLTTSGGTQMLLIPVDKLVPGGTITLIDYQGTSPITTGFTAGGLPPRTAASIVYNTANTSIDFSFQGIDSVKWNGNVSATWDVGTAEGVGGTSNFKLASNSATTNFVTNDAVTFDDSAAGNFIVDVPANVTPRSLGFNNSLNDYKLVGLGAIAGPVGIVKDGTARLTLTNDNTYTGLTTINAGTVQIGDGGTTGSVAGDIAVGAGGTLAFNRSNDLTYAKVISGAGIISKDGSGQLTLVGDNTFTGTINVNQGTVLLDALGGLGDIDAATININNGGTFIFGENGNVDFPSSTFVTINAGGQFIIKQGETYGGIFLKGGTLLMTGAVNTGVNSDGVGSTGHTVESGTINATFTGTSIGGALSGTGLNKVTSGTVDIIGAVKFADALPINIKDGTLAMNVANVPTAGTGAITLGEATAPTAGTFKIKDAGAATIPRAVVVTAGGGTIETADAGGAITLAGVLSGAGSLTKSGPGIVTIAGTANTLTGQVVVTAGTLRLDGTIPASAGAKVQGGTLEIRSSQTLQSLEVSGGTLAVAAPVPGAALVVPVVKTLSVTGTGRLDLGNSGLIVDYTGTSPVESIRALIIAGRGGSGGAGAAVAPMITGIATLGSTTGLAVGYAEAADLGSPVAFLGATVPDTTSLLIRTTLPADATMDGKVDFDDLLRLAQNYNATGAGWSQADFTYDGKVDFDDLLLLAQNYNAILPLAAAAATSASASGDFAADVQRAMSATSGSAAVPEPGSLAVMLLGTLAMTTLRRRPIRRHG